MHDVDSLASLGLPPIDQVGYVVRDLDAALLRYGPIFGPFQVMEAPLNGALLRGQPRDCTLRLAFGRSGGLEVELIAVASGDSPHAEFLAAGREGLHHVRYRVADVDSVLRSLEPLGFSPLWYHDMGFAKFAYAEHAARDGIVLELLQMPPA